MQVGLCKRCPGQCTRTLLPTRRRKNPIQRGKQSQVNYTGANQHSEKLAPPSYFSAPFQKLLHFWCCDVGHQDKEYTPKKKKKRVYSSYLSFSNLDLLLLYIPAGFPFHLGWARQERRVVTIAVRPARFAPSSTAPGIHQGDGISSSKEQFPLPTHSCSPHSGWGDGGITNGSIHPWHCVTAEREPQNQIRDCIRKQVDTMWFDNWTIHPKIWMTVCSGGPVFLSSLKGDTVK